MKKSIELLRLINSAKISKDYPECIKKEYVCRIPYCVAVNLMRKNNWTKKTLENHFWNAFNIDSKKINYGLHYT